MAASRLAAFDGYAWSPVGGGTDGEVRSLMVYNGQLIVGGSFQAAGGLSSRLVAGWNGFFWTAMANGMILGTTAHALAVCNGQLYAGGDFSQNFRRWDAPGSTWVSQGVFGGTVYALQPWGSFLYAGGAFDSIDLNTRHHLARWNGSQWLDVGGGVDDNVYALALHGSSLFIGGAFHNYAGGNPQHYVIQWLGSFWGETDCGPSCGLKGVVRSLVSWGGQLYAGGNFNAGGISGNIRHVAVWDGGFTWNPVAGGIGSTLPGVDAVHTLCTFRGELYAGGTFSSPQQFLARTDGNAWRAPVDPPVVNAIATYGAKVALAGAFAQTPIGLNAGYHLAVWNGQDLETLTSGTDGPVHALTGYTDSTFPRRDRLVVGGAFTSAGGFTARNVALWTETDTFFRTGWTALGNGFDGDVLALARLSGKTIAGGAFAFSGGTAVANVARWDGTQWSPMGTGMDGPVFALKSYTVNASSFAVVAGGAFTTANGVPVNGVASWGTIVPETPWAPLGVGFNGIVYAVERHAANTWAGGTFTASGATAVNHVAKYVSGTGWVQVGGGLSGTVRALKSEGGSLYAAGNFPGQVARLEGATWVIVANGTDGGGLALGAYQNEVLAGGVITTAGGGGFPTVSAPGAARFLETGSPYIVAPPTPRTVDVGVVASFSVGLADNDESPTHAWRKDGVPLNDGPTGRGSTLFGSHGPTLSIQSTVPPDSGVYDCMVTNHCGSVTSGGARLTVTGVSGGPDPATPAISALLLSPDPFRDTVSFRFNLVRSGLVDLDIFDVLGRRVHHRAPGSTPPKCKSLSTGEPGFRNRQLRRSSSCPLHEARFSPTTCSLAVPDARRAMIATTGSSWRTSRS